MIKPPAFPPNIISGLFGSITIEVSPQQLYTASDELLTTVSSLQSKFDSVNSRVTGMRYYWEGRVSERRQKSYKKSEKQTREMLELIKKYSEELKQIASNYTETEKYNTEDSASLPSGILS